MARNVYSSLLGFDELVTTPTLLFTVPSTEVWIITDMEVASHGGVTLMNPVAGQAHLGFIEGEPWSVHVDIMTSPNGHFAWGQWNGRLVVPTLFSWYGATEGEGDTYITISGYRLTLP